MLGRLQYKEHLETHTRSSLNIYRSLCICPVSGFICSTLPRSLRQQFQMTSGMETSMANQIQGRAELPLTDKANRQQSAWADLHLVCAHSFITNKTADREPWKEKLSLNYACKHQSAVGILVRKHAVLKEDTGLELQFMTKEETFYLYRVQTLRLPALALGQHLSVPLQMYLFNRIQGRAFCLFFFIYSLFAFFCNITRFRSLSSAWNYVICSKYSWVDLHCMKYIVLKYFSASVFPIYNNPNISLQSP